jgi:hypothetical protein
LEYQKLHESVKKFIEDERIKNYISRRKFLDIDSGYIFNILIISFVVIYTIAYFFYLNTSSLIDWDNKYSLDIVFDIIGIVFLFIGWFVISYAFVCMCCIFFVFTPFVFILDI